MICLHLKSYLPAFLALVALGSPLCLRAASGSENTASYVTAHIDTLDGKTVSLDVVAVRLMRPFTTNESFVVLGAGTWDDENNSRGGKMLVIANKDDKDKLVGRYGTTPEHQGRDVETKSMRGVVRLADVEGFPPLVYLDLTDGAFEPTAEQLRELAGMHGGPRGRRGPPEGRGDGPPSTDQDSDDGKLPY
ncbi:hypothetical protein [Ruficoccus sp. ZRK36]|uniref:hypothetical protein n=1 Tax=Ruficoccus sp. ZRK36 TaxID=2866311 RepID=UPI001C730813|nr:hypothetical protein [Ruficoccus sp. ZRK36]QYY35594.1 hypothetical protein K0V07_15005 [Ruficoccus sp. ZRK36]